jgi:alkylation response protein AidB-like acyl-CoA dehydrogenase
MDLLGERGLVEPAPDEAEMGIRRFTDGRWVSQYMMSLSTAIAGGASNIQRNIIGERLLGLPRDRMPAGH